jgi:DNA (cytosine-5)-methyltransferase 1
MLTMGSLFSGSGGFELAASLCGIKPVWASEIEPFPIRVTTRRLPDVKHLGNVCNIDGGAIEAVDIITFGSPCVGLSVAGKREGLKNRQSVLFYEAVRIIRQMREATGGVFPRIAVWENVPGCLISNNGEDFHHVIKELVRLKDGDAVIPRPQKWSNAGIVVGDGYSLAWRILDAQFLGVPQRRKRVYLVVDFGSERAGEILTEPHGQLRNFASGFEAGQGTAGDSVDRAEAAGGVDCLTPWDWQNMRVASANGVAPTLSGCDGGGGERNPAGYVFGLCSKGSNAWLSDYKFPQQQQVDENKCIVESLRGSYHVRRLTPKECASVQGFPRWWCDRLETPEPTEEEIAYWTHVFEDHRLATNPAVKPKTRKQIVKWLRTPYSDAAEYKLWGNGINLNCAIFVFRGIMEQEELINA